MRKAAKILGIVALALALAGPALAQGCAMCYNDAAATGKQGTATLQRAILVLMIPPLSIFGGILGMLYVRRDSSREIEDL
jgi:hypothetical protein